MIIVGYNADGVVSLESLSFLPFVSFAYFQVNFTPFDTKWVPMSAKLAVVGCYPKGTGVIQGQLERTNVVCQ